MLIVFTCGNLHSCVSLFFVKTNLYLRLRVRPLVDHLAHDTQFVCWIQFVSKFSLCLALRLRYPIATSICHSMHCFSLCNFHRMFMACYRCVFCSLSCLAMLVLFTLKFYMHVDREEPLFYADEKPRQGCLGGSWQQVRISMDFGSLVGTNQIESTRSRAGYSGSRNNSGGVRLLGGVNFCCRRICSGGWIIYGIIWDNIG